MPVYLALFRGINVSGHNMIKMDALKKLMEAEGHQNVETYIQSGNVVFETEDTNRDRVGKSLETLMYKEYGYDVVIFMMDINDVRKAIDSNPYTGREPEGQGAKKFFVAFLNGVPTTSGIDQINKYNRSDDAFKVVGNVLYLKLAQSAADSKLTNVFLENKLGLKATTRNWNTTLKVLEMLEARAK
ncbi:DUF1697 domain-containing protein [Flavobacterium subsaxonicum]|uniref:DUF1697 domain-containing protein n=1 Tax=Flavobacterium subsaxonicum WB 4.1-42 = DSM 21790 TaxID=1121898 RepID=A0A0A2MS88_9FLAO|nr:DUF1697 domain-containing protein [Flavobacterium subsaxonicum]KGO95169.1 hypothetical protein Q766_03480 [Flavobacterium subsaxonicum WB 4.1-42 = DSM 21790]